MGQSSFTPWKSFGLGKKGWGETESKQIWVESWLLYLSAVQLRQVVDVSGPEFLQFWNLRPAWHVTVDGKAFPATAMEREAGLSSGKAVLFLCYLVDQGHPSASPSCDHRGQDNTCLQGVQWLPTRGAQHSAWPIGGNPQRSWPPTPAQSLFLILSFFVGRTPQHAGP